MVVDKAGCIVICHIALSQLLLYDVARVPVEQTTGLSIEGRHHQ